MYIVLALLTLTTFMATIVAVFTGHYWVAAHQLVIFLLAAYAFYAEKRIDQLTVRNILLWRHYERVRKLGGATSPEGETDE